MEVAPVVNFRRIQEGQLMEAVGFVAPPTTTGISGIPLFSAVSISILIGSW